MKIFKISKDVRGGRNKYYNSLVDPMRRLDFNYNQKIGEGIEGAAKGYLPINREKLKEENPELFLKIS